MIHKFIITAASSFITASIFLAILRWFMPAVSTNGMYLVTLGIGLALLVFVILWWPDPYE